MIYIIRPKGSIYVKIGYTSGKKSLRLRIKSLQTGCADKLVVELTMRGSKSKERYIHHLCASRWTSGEWFRLNQDETRRLVAKYADFKVPTHNEDGSRFRIPDICATFKNKARGLGYLVVDAEGARRMPSIKPKRKKKAAHSGQS